MQNAIRRLKNFFIISVVVSLLTLGAAVKSYGNLLRRLNMATRDLEQHVIVVGFLLELCRAPDPNGAGRVREMMQRHPDAKEDPDLIRLFNRVQTYRNSQTQENLDEVMKAARQALERRK